MTSPKTASQLPTELELMAYFDGELEPARSAEIEAFLARSEDESARRAAQKLDGLAALSRWVRLDASTELDGADGDAAGPARGVHAPLDDTFTDELMARIASSAALGDDPPKAERVGGAPPQRSAPVGGVRPASSDPTTKPANDNGGLLWGLVAVAAAAAAGMFFWGKSQVPLVDERLALTASAPTAELSGASPSGSAPSALAAAEPDAETTGVEIAAVDFGSASGAIYYVPKSGSLVGAATTTVVWLADE